jgi:hypothetical protein
MAEDSKRVDLARADLANAADLVEAVDLAKTDGLAKALDSFTGIATTEYNNIERD